MDFLLNRNKMNLRSFKVKVCIILSRYRTVIGKSCLLINPDDDVIGKDIFGTAL